MTIATDPRERCLYSPIEIDIFDSTHARLKIPGCALGADHDPSPMI